VVSHESTSYIRSSANSSCPGAPIVNATTQDDPELGADANRNNDFKFKAKDQSACPFAAHIRKMNPRGDLQESGIVDHMILRRGIPFGPEVSDEEKSSHTTTQERGLLFVCYQSSLSSGFSFLQGGKIARFRPRPFPFSLKSVHPTNIFISLGKPTGLPIRRHPHPGLRSYYWTTDWRWCTTDDWCFRQQHGAAFEPACTVGQFKGWRVLFLAFAAYAEECFRQGGKCDGGLRVPI
jgi:hypothetical protein